MDQRREREITLRDYLDVVIKRKLIITLSVVVVTISSLLLIPPESQVYKATAFIIVEGSHKDSDLAKSLIRFIKSPALTEEVIRHIRFEKAETLKAGGELAERSVFSITPKALRENILVEAEESNILQISVLSGNPREAMDIANATAKVTVEKSLKGITRGPQSSLRYVERQIEILERKIDEVKRTLARYTSEMVSETVLLPEEEYELEGLQQDYINTKLSRQMAEARLNVLEERLNGQKDEEVLLSILPESEELIRLRDEMSKLEKTRSELLVQFTKEHPSVIEVQNEIDRTEELIKIEIRKPLEDLKEQIAKAKNKEDTLREIMETRFPVVDEGRKERRDDSPSIPQLMRELKIHEKTYDILLDKKEKLRLDILLDATKVRILRLATEPETPEKTEGPPALLIAISLGLILGLTAAFIQENMDTSLKTVEEVEYYLNLPIIGVIPYIRPEKKGDLYK